MRYICSVLLDAGSLIRERRVSVPTVFVKSQWPLLSTKFQEEDCVSSSPNETTCERSA